MLLFLPFSNPLETVYCSGRHSGLGELVLLVTLRNLSAAWLVSFLHTIHSLNFELRHNISSNSSFFFSSILEVIVLLLLTLKASSSVCFSDNNHVYSASTRTLIFFFIYFLCCGFSCSTNNFKYKIQC